MVLTVQQTVGECPWTPDINDIRKMVSAEAKSLSMVFQFEIAVIDHGRDYAQLAREWTLPEFKKHLKFYQELCEGCDSWATNYIGEFCFDPIVIPSSEAFDLLMRDSGRCVIVGNHDQARPVSRYASDMPGFRVASAKMLAMYLLTLTGTPFIVSRLRS